MDMSTAEGLVRARVAEVLAPLSLRAEARAYALDRKGSMRWPFLVTAHVEASDAVRTFLMQALGLHMLSVKLIDDLVDGDTPYERADLVSGVFLLQCATADLCQLQNRAAVRARLERAYGAITEGQILELRARPVDFATWLACVHCKAGLVVATYAEVATLATQDTSQIPPEVSEFFYALGQILMLRDDFLDADKDHEGGGSIRQMLRAGIVSEAEALGFLAQATATTRRHARFYARTPWLLDATERYAATTAELVRASRAP